MALVSNLQFIQRIPHDYFPNSCIVVNVGAFPEKPAGD
jgi:hypothetical protein